MKSNYVSCGHMQSVVTNEIQPHAEWPRGLISKYCKQNKFVQP